MKVIVKCAILVYVGVLSRYISHANTEGKRPCFAKIQSCNMDCDILNLVFVVSGKVYHVMYTSSYAHALYVEIGMILEN